MHEDKETSEMCKGKLNEEALIMMTGLRFGLSERVAEIKVKSNPFDYIYNGNDYLLFSSRGTSGLNTNLFEARLLYYEYTNKYLFNFISIRL